MEFDIVIIALLTLAAGFLGTIVMTIGQIVEMRFTGRAGSFSPAIAFSKIFGINFDALTEKNKTVLTYVVHFLYGTVWAVPLALLLFAGFTNYLSIFLAYFLIVWVQGMVVVPLLGIAPPPWKWGIGNLLKDGLHHFIYALATSLIFIKLAELVLSPVA